MFSLTRPTAAAIERFIHGSRELPLSYEPVGIAATGAARGSVDDEVDTIGHGAADFARARDALRTWKQFGIGWVELVPANAATTTGTNVAVVIRHFGFWSINGCRVVYSVGDGDPARFGYAYGTLTNHAEAGEELFEVFLDPRTGNVMYHIRATSWPRVTLTRLGQPLVRMLQARFRRDSIAAMKRAIEVAGAGR